jgi:hypothetical protein
MRRFDKIKNMKKANLLAEQRYKTMLNESTDDDIINIVNQQVNAFSLEEDYFDNGKFEMSYFGPKVEGIVYENEAVSNIGLNTEGTYEMTSKGHYAPGRCYGPPEDCYPDESEDPEFDINIRYVSIRLYNENGENIETILLHGEQLRNLSSNLIGNIEGDVEEMLLKSGDFDPRNNNNNNYDGPDEDFY